MSKSKTRWDLYAWVGSGDIKLRESNLTLKEAKKAKEKWVSKSPKHEAFIASHEDKKIVKSLLKSTKPTKTTKSKSKSKSTSKKKSKSKSKKK